MPDFAKQLKTFRLSAHLKQKDIADVMGVTPTAVSDYESGKRTPSLDLIVLLANRYNLSISWLITAHGDMYNNVRARESHAPCFIDIPVVAPIAAGFPLSVAESEPLERLQIPASLLHLPPPYYAFRVEGESMSPYIIEGDIVILSRDWRDLDLDGRICGFRTQDGITLKKLVYVHRQKTAWLMPLNHDYTPTPYNKDTEDLILFGVLVLSIRKY